MRARTNRQVGRVTLSDIAQRAGVSVSTASLVLSNKAKERRISADAVSRIEEAAAQLDYSPNLLVHSLQRGLTNILCFYNGFRDRRENDLYMDRLSTSIERAGGALGYDILVYCDFSRTDEATYRVLNGGRSDGLIFFAPLADDPLFEYLRDSRLPTVLINRVDVAGKLSSIRDDQEDGMAQVARKLVQLGHTRIAALTNSPHGNKDGDERVRSLRKYLAEAGIHIPDAWVVPTDDLIPDHPRRSLEMLLGENDPPTALFCWHDLAGYQILEHCEAMGVRVPEELSVVGYDGLRWPAMTRHELASVSVNLDKMAQEAVGMLDSLLLGKAQGPI